MPPRSRYRVRSARRCRPTDVPSSDSSTVTEYANSLEWIQTPSRTVDLREVIVQFDFMGAIHGLREAFTPACGRRDGTVDEDGDRGSEQGGSAEDRAGRRLAAALIEGGHVEVRSRERFIAALADFLGNNAAPGEVFPDWLIDHDEVREVFADDATLRRLLEAALP
jgi:hypothetical protein